MEMEATWKQVITYIYVNYENRIQDIIQGNKPTEFEHHVLNTWIEREWCSRSECSFVSSSLSNISVRHVLMRVVKCLLRVCWVCITQVRKVQVHHSPLLDNFSGSGS